MRPEIRVRAEADLLPCAAALRALHLTDGYPQTMPPDPVAWLQPLRQRHAWVAVSAGAVAGHIALNVAEGDPAVSVSSAATGLAPDKLAVVSRLFVVREHRRVGIGLLLLGRAVGAAHDEGKRPVLDVLEADRGAISFYERAGWERVGGVIFTSRAGEPLPAYVYAGPQSPSARC